MWPLAPTSPASTLLPLPRIRPFTLLCCIWEALVCIGQIVVKRDMIDDTQPGVVVSTQHSVL